MENEKNSETSPWEINDKKSTVLDIDMRILQKFGNKSLPKIAE